MDTTRTPPPPSANATPSAGGRRSQLRLRWRQLAADVADLLLVGLVGAAVSAALLWDPGPADPQAGFESLAAALLALMVGAGAAGVAAVVVLTMAWRSRSPGDRLLRTTQHGPGGLAAAGGKLGRAVAVVFAATGLAGAGNEFTAPTALAPAVAAASAATGVGLFVVVYAHRRSSVAWHRFAAVAAIAGLVAGAAALGTPDRDLYPWEVRRVVTDRLPQALEALGGQRVCADQGLPAGPSASHATEPCFDPDEVWAVRGAGRTVAQRVADQLRADVDVDVAIGVGETMAGNDPAWEVLIDGRPEAYVATTPCGTRVRVSDSANYPLLMERFLPDVALAGRCA